MDRADLGQTLVQAPQATQRLLSMAANLFESISILLFSGSPCTCIAPQGSARMIAEPQALVCNPVTYSDIIAAVNIDYVNLSFGSHCELP